MEYKNLLKNSTLLISGGTGSFGTTLLKKLINCELKEIRIFSRDEKKQDDIRRILSTDNVKFYLGDVRDYSSIENATKDVDFIFHAAALKQVPSCEFFPFEAVKTNIIGTENILNAAIKNLVKKVICLSTDKAVYPINAMGLSKSLMEKVALAKSRDSYKTEICVTRYGNVMATRGSVIPLFINQIAAKKPITITNPNMTRFIMSIEEAIELVFYAFKNGKSGETFVQKSPSSTIDVLYKSITKTLNCENYPFEIIGTRHGEKLYEVLLSKEEMNIAIEDQNYYKLKSDFRSLNYEKYIGSGMAKEELSEYNSHNTYKLSVDELCCKLKSLDIIKSFLNKKI